MIHEILETVEKAIALHRTHMHKTTHMKYKMHLNNLLHQKRVRINDMESKDSETPQNQKLAPLKKNNKNRQTYGKTD